MRLFRNNPISTSYLSREIIQSRSSPTIWHPSYRVRHFSRKSDMIYPGLQGHLLFYFCNGSSIQRYIDPYFSRNFLRNDLVYNQFIRQTSVFICQQLLSDMVVRYGSYVVKTKSNRAPDTTCHHSDAPVPTVTIRSLTAEHTKMFLVMIVIRRIIEASGSILWQRLPNR